MDTYAFDLARPYCPDRNMPWAHYCLALYPCGHWNEHVYVKRGEAVAMPVLTSLNTCLVCFSHDVYIERDSRRN